ncbi:MAG: 50S ribosomal protein L28 [Verrucomicrobiota bacterium]|nr:50S ribosomal protein L28 [Verrucomicrobiota bacterium]
MSKICEIFGTKLTVGGSITRRGRAKKEGGIGTHIVKRNKRVFRPNIQKKKFYIPETDSWVTLNVSVKAIRTINKNGIMPVLRKAKKAGFLKQNVPGL